MKNIEIAKILNDTVHFGHKVYVASDWHMYKFDKESGLIAKRPDYDRIIENFRNTVDADDSLIYLGDLVDAEMRDHDAVIDIIEHIPCRHKFMVRGNNDTFADEFYTTAGFEDIKYAIIWRQMAFSHTSIDRINKLARLGIYNVHGHIHRDGWNVDDIPYYHDATRCFNMCNPDNMPVDTDWIYDNIEQLANNNNNSIEGFEKPGMSTFVKNMAEAEIDRIIKENDM